MRVGNAAADQFQLDVWGEVLDGLHLARECGLPTDDTAWDLQRALLDFLEGHWQEPDSSLWEIRGPARHFVHSKVMAWAGVDRAVRTVERHDLPGPLFDWRALRDQIHGEVCAHGYDADRGCFTQSYGSTELDAALLLLPRVGFLPYADPRMVGTVEAVQRDLTRDGLLLRYDPEASDDGLPGVKAPSWRAVSGWSTPSAGSAAAMRRPPCSSGCWDCATTWACSARSTTPPPDANWATPRKRSAWSGSSTAPANSTVTTPPPRCPVTGSTSERKGLR